MHDNHAERAAKAAYNAFRGSLELPWDQISDQYQDEWRGVAQAVLATTANPSIDCPDLLCAGWEDSSACPNGFKHRY